MPTKRWHLNIGNFITAAGVKLYQRLRLVLQASVAERPVVLPPAIQEGQHDQFPKTARAGGASRQFSPDHFSEQRGPIGGFLHFGRRYSDHLWLELVIPRKATQLLAKR